MAGVVHPAPAAEGQATAVPEGGHAMQVQQQFRWFPGQALALALALFAAAALGIGAGYELRDHGFRGLTGATAQAPAAKKPAYAKPAYLEPDAADRSATGATTVKPVYLEPDASDRNTGLPAAQHVSSAPIHGPTP
jgi:hypothetical protein